MFPLLSVQSVDIDAEDKERSFLTESIVMSSSTVLLKLERSFLVPRHRRGGALLLARGSVDRTNSLCKPGLASRDACLKPFSVPADPGKTCNED